MKKVVIVVCILLAIGVVVLWWLGMKTVQEINEVPTVAALVSVDEEEQDYCDSLGPQSGSASLSNFFVSNLRENMLLENNTLIKACIKNINNSFGNWDIKDGYIASYTIYNSKDNLVSRGVFPLEEQYLKLSDLGQLTTHIPFEKNILIGDTRGDTAGYIYITNNNLSGNPESSKEIILQVKFN